MPKQVTLSPRAALAKGALFTYLGPRLAQDAKLDLTPVLAKIQAGKPFAESKAAVIAALKSQTDGKLAQDADIEDVAALMDAVERVVDEPSVVVPEEMNTEGTELIDVDNDGDPEIVKDDEPPETMAKIREFVAAHVDDETLAQFDELVGAAHEGDAPEVDDVIDKEDDDMTRDSGMRRPAMDAALRARNVVTRPAMDAAIAAAVTGARAAERAEARAIREAERAVRPYVGELAIACDSADEVYKTALKALNVRDVDKIHPSAYPALLEAQPRGNARRPEPRFAQDSAAGGGKSFAERHPAAARIGHA